MLFRFNIGRSRSGGLGLRVTPVYYMPYWRVVQARRHRLVCRPSERTFLHLLGISGMALFLLVFITWSAGFPWSADEEQKQAALALQGPERQAQIENVRKLTEELKKNLSPAKVAEIDRQQAKRQSELKNQLDGYSSGLRFIRAVDSIIHWFAFCALSAIVVLPLVGYPLQRVIVERTADDEFVIRKRGLWQSTHRWPLATFGQIVYTPEEEMANTYTIGWRWMVKLRVLPQVSLENGPSLVDDTEIAFYIDFVKHRPANDDPPPQSVKVLVKHLRRVTGIDTVARSTLGSDKWGFFGRRRRRTTTTTVTSEPEVTRRVYNSLNEVPEYLCDRARQMLEKARHGDSAVHQSVRITIRDSDGNEQTYHSLDDMPPEVRARYAPRRET